MPRAFDTFPAIPPTNTRHVPRAVGGSVGPESARALHPARLLHMHRDLILNTAFRSEPPNKPSRGCFSLSTQPSCAQVGTAARALLSLALINVHADEHPPPHATVLPHLSPARYIRSSADATEIFLRLDLRLGCCRLGDLI